jgi:lysozyme
VWTQVQADQDLLDRVEALGKHIDAVVKIELSDEEKGALCSLSYNIGTGNFDHSTLLALLNAGKVEEAAKEFPKWNKAAGKVLAGLVTRRSGEMAEFLLGLKEVTV